MAGFKGFEIDEHGMLQSLFFFWEVGLLKRKAHGAYLDVRGTT